MVPSSEARYWALQRSKLALKIVAGAAVISQTCPALSRSTEWIAASTLTISSYIWPRCAGAFYCPRARDASGYCPHRTPSDKTSSRQPRDLHRGGRPLATGTSVSANALTTRYSRSTAWADLSSSPARLATQHVAAGSGIDFKGRVGLTAGEFGER